MEHILEIRGLRVRYHTDDGTVNALNSVDLTLKEGVTLGLVGETGAGKTTLAKSIMQLIPSPPGRIEEGEICFRGEDILKAPVERMREIRGKEISMIFQDPMSSLNPVMTVGEQITEVVATHEKSSGDARKRPWKCWRWWAYPRSGRRITPTSSPAV